MNKRARQTPKQVGLKPPDPPRPTVSGSAGSRPIREPRPQTQTQTTTPPLESAHQCATRMGYITDTPTATPAPAPAVPSASLRLFAHSPRAQGVSAERALVRVQRWARLALASGCITVLTAVPVGVSMVPSDVRSGVMGAITAGQGAVSAFLSHQVSRETPSVGGGQP